MNIQNGVISDQSCNHCGYTLDGLPVGSNCPECGKSSTLKSKNIREATMSFQAPTWYVKWIRNGFYLCLLSIFGGLSLPIIGAIVGTTSMLFPISLLLFVLASGLWAAGVWMITRTRKDLGEVSKDEILDNQKFVHFIRILSIAWPCWIFLMTIGAVAPNIGASMPFEILAAVVGLVAWIGLIPACVYFAELSYWAADEWLSNRLRAVAWFMTVFGVLALTAKFLSITSLPISAPAKLVYIWTYAISFIATLVLFHSVFRMSILMNWVLGHQAASADKYKRLAERTERHMNHQGKHSTKTPCEYCSYDLIGLPYNGYCPECGEQYGEGKPLLSGDPGIKRTPHDDTPIEVADSSGGTVRHARGLGLPLEDLPTPEYDDDGEGDIPLAGE